MATPSLAMIPSGYKASKVYSVLPENGVGDFNFTRATTAIRINSSGLIETVATNVPRLEYPLIDGVVNGCPSLLLEPQRTNLLLQSNQFDTTWTNTNTTVTSGQVGVGGSSDAWKVDISSAFAQVEQTVSNNGVQTFSVYAKAGTLNWIRLRVDHTSFSGTYFDLQNGQVGSTVGTDSTSIENLGNGWYRCTIVVDDNVTRARIYPASANNDLSATSGNIYIQYAQLEQGSYATSYIPTNGSTVTRNAETCNGAGDSATFNDSEGVLMAEISALVDDQTRRQISVSDGTVQNVVRLHYHDTDSNIIRFQIRSNDIIEVSSSFTVNNIKEFHKVAIFYRLNDVKFFIDGFKVGTDTSAAMPIGLDVLNFDQGNGFQKFYGKTKQIQYYNSALTDSELETLTSWTSFSDMANGQQYSII